MYLFINHGKKIQQPSKSVSENAVSSCGSKISSNMSYITYHLRKNIAEIVCIRFVLILWSMEMINIIFKFDPTYKHDKSYTGPRSAVGNVSGYRCESDCRSRGREFDPGPVPYFRGD